MARQEPGGRPVDSIHKRKPGQTHKGRLGRVSRTHEPLRLQSPGAKGRRMGDKTEENKRHLGA